jgi:DinB superfamily
MATREDYAKQPFEKRLERMSRTPDELATAIRGRSDAELSRRPDPKNWAAKEVICHLRDVEEVYFARARSIVINDVEVKIYADPSAVERWPTNRQYLRWDATEAVAAFRELREGFLAFLRGLTPGDRQRGCIHPTRGRLTIDDFVTMFAWHDDNHLDQLARALEGRA